MRREYDAAVVIRDQVAAVVRRFVETEPAPATEQETVEAFHKLWYDLQRRVKWLGTRTLKCPLDLWVYQEILFEKRPDLIIETGTNRGGTTSYLAAICDLIDTGRIITVDWQEREGRPPHRRVTYLHGDSAGPEIVSQITDAIRPGDTVMAILDSNHAQSHVAKELSGYAPLVTPGQYLIVEDTNLNGHPVRRDFGPGPMEAVEEFLETELGRDFAPDKEREKFLMTLNPNGYLLRQ